MEIKKKKTEAIIVGGRRVKVGQKISGKAIPANLGGQEEKSEVRITKASKEQDVIILRYTNRFQSTEKQIKKHQQLVFSVEEFKGTHWFKMCPEIS